MPKGLQAFKICSQLGESVGERSFSDVLRYFEGNKVYSSLHPIPLMQSKRYIQKISPSIVSMNVNSRT